MINYNETNDNCNCNTPMMGVLPDDDMRRWACKQVVTMLANSDYYYTRDEVDRLIASIEPDITKEEVEQMIYQATSGKQNTLIAGDGIDITNDVISVTGMVATSAVTSAVTSSSTDVVTSGGVYDQMGGMKILHLTQAQYDQLQNKDNMTLYVITNS